MPHLSKNTPDSNFHSSPIPDLAALAEKLQEAAQALLAVCQNQGDHDDSDESEACPESPADDLKPPFEIRSYEIPDYILRDEQDLLAKTNAHDLHDALNKVYGHINSVVHLMQQYSAEEEMDGLIVNDLAEVLLVPLDWLELICSTITGFRLVHHMKTE